MFLTGLRLAPLSRNPLARRVMYRVKTPESADKDSPVSNDAGIWGARLHGWSDLAGVPDLSGCRANLASYRAGSERNHMM